MDTRLCAASACMFQNLKPELSTSIPNTMVVGLTGHRLQHFRSSTFTSHRPQPFIPSTRAALAFPTRGRVHHSAVSSDGHHGVHL